MASTLFAHAHACREFILLEDLYWFLPEDKAKAALAVLDVDADGKVSMADMRDAVVAIYKERKNLACTLKVLLCKQHRA